MNPYKFARYTYTMWVDADKILDRSMGNDRRKKMEAFNVMTDPRVAPYTDQQAVVNDFAIEEFGGDDPDKYKKKGGENDVVPAPTQSPIQTPQPKVPAGSSPPAGLEINA